MKKKQRNLIWVSIILASIIIFTLNLQQNTMGVIIAGEPDCYTTTGEVYIKMCSIQSSSEVRIIDGVGRAVYSDGDYIEVYCEPSDVILYKNTNTGECDEYGCSGIEVSNPYRKYLTKQESGINPEFVCYKNNGEFWNRRGVNLGPFTYVCTEDWTCSEWSSCVNSQKTRNCVDSNYCGTTTNKPTENQDCYTPVCSSLEKQCGGECPPCPEPNTLIYVILGGLAISGGLYYLYKKSTKKGRR